MLREAYGDNALKKSNVFEWQKRFKYGWENVKDDKKHGQPKTQQNFENVVRVQQLVQSDRQLSVWMMAEELKLEQRQSDKDFETIWG